MTSTRFSPIDDIKGRPPAPRPVPPPPYNEGTRRIVFRLEPELHHKLTTAVADRKIGQGQIILNAIEAAYQAGVLTQLVLDEAGGPAGELFPRLKGRVKVEASIPVEMRLPASAAAVLDRLVTETGAESRTQLITAALRHYLTHSDRLQ